MKDILVHVDDTPAGAVRVELALELAAAHSAYLTGLHVEPDSNVPAGTALDHLESALRLSKSTNATIARRSREMFRGSTAKTAVPHRWLSATGDVAQIIASHSRYSDLVIVGQYESQGDPVHHPLPVCHRIALKAGRPILVLPDSTRNRASFSRLLIAWDGSPQSVRAVHDSLPFLTRASSVKVLVVQPESEHLPQDVVKPDWLSQHLLNHGVIIGAWQVSDRRERVAKSIYRVISGEAFDLLVMGAYSRPDWFQFILGGTTQTLLLTSPIPLLISH